MLLSIQEIIGPFHPVLVHLPIGILILAVILQWLSTKEKYRAMYVAVPVIYLFGFIGALLSCITGLSLASGGEYDQDTLDLHKWMGIITAVLSLTGFILSRSNTTNTIKIILAVILFMLITITGHLGGTLTHGEGYLTKAFNADADSSGKIPKKIITNVQEAAAYGDIIQPMLQEKCYTCHSSTKQKGNLRLDGKDWILKGGKEGEVLLAGKPEESEMYKRLLLDPLEDHHMPPKGKPQLSEKEINLLHWWISNGSEFEKKVKEIAQTEKIKTTLLSLQSTSAGAVKIKPLIPAAEIEKAPAAAITALQEAGVIVLPVSANTNYLLANFVSVKNPDEKIISLLQPLKKQLVWLKLANTSLSETSLKTIADCNNLTRLNIEYSNINDAGLILLKRLTHLQYLNLVATKVTGKGVEQLKDLPALENIYLGQTQIQKNEWPDLIKLFPKTKLDSGGYQVQYLETDTMLVKAPMVQK